jgi:uncharacterized membrane protein
VTTIKQKRPLILLGFGFVASLVAYSHALGPYLTFEGEGPIGQILTLFLFPITATVIYYLIGSLRASRAGLPADPAAEAALNSIVLCILLFLISVHLIVLGVLLQLQAVLPWASRGVVVLVGLTLIAVGNLLPRTRPNVALGIRTSRTLVDRQLWMSTHRAGGYVAVSVGVVTVVSGLFLPRPHAAAFPGIAFLAGVGIIVVCYWKFSRMSTGQEEV